jgi:hypothetical protein
MKYLTPSIYITYPDHDSIITIPLICYNPKISVTLQDKNNSIKHEEPSIRCHL